MCRPKLYCAREVLSRLTNVLLSIGDNAQPVAGSRTGLRRGAGRVKRPLVPPRRLFPLLLPLGDNAQLEAGTRTGRGRGAGRVEC